MINGIHHITALASDPQRNIDFYVNVLGFRLVKRTVNFDAPDVYHLYYGDESGVPGTILTFFPFPDAARGERGTGEISAVAFDVPGRSMEYWVERLARFDVHVDGPSTRFDEQAVSFQDPDGMIIELVFSRMPSASAHWNGSTVPREFAIRRLHGATLLLGGREETDRLLVQTLGFQRIGREGARMRYEIGNGANVAAIDLLVRPGLPPARQSAGSVHHIAWRVADDVSQLQWREKLIAAGLYPTGVLDRNYFRSIYFREPGGVLFEIATDAPGFTIDEPLAELGTELKLPGWLEPERSKLERILPPIDLKLKEVL